MNRRIKSDSMYNQQDILKFSVLISTYNRAESIIKCLESLVNQNYPKEDYEVIVLNNNSKDNTETAVEKFIKDHKDTNIRYYFVPRAGQVYARQIGILAAKNEILSFTDDDAILMPDWIKEIANVFNLNKKAVGVAGKIEIKWDETPPDWIRDYETQLGKLNYGDEILYKKGLYMNAGNLSIKKEVLIEVGGFNPEMVGEWLVGDGETGLWLRLKSRGYLIGWAPKALMLHCQIAKKNATIDDIKRRFINNGICKPYNIYAIDKGGAFALFKNMLKAMRNGIYWQYRKAGNLIRGRKKGVYEAMFKSAYHFAQVRYTLKLFTDKEFRRAITREDWIVKNNKTPVAAL